MKTWFQRRVALVAGGILASVTGAGIQSAYGSDHCNSIVTGCISTNTVTMQTCCEDFDGDGVFHLVTCQRRAFECMTVNGIYSMQWGPVQNCGSPGAICC